MRRNDLIERKVVTVATRYAQTVEQAPSIVTVITAADIRQFGYRKVTDILQSIPGIYIKTSKEGRDLAWFRGVISDDNNKILLLVDGVPWYDGGYTHAWLDEYIPLFHVKQVEIIKGPGSAVYGTNAFSGVINIVTYTPEELDGGMVRFQPVHLPDKKSVRWLVIPMEMCHLKFMQEALMSMATGWILIQKMSRIARTQTQTVD